MPDNSEKTKLGVLYIHSALCTSATRENLGLMQGRAIRLSEQILDGTHHATAADYTYLKCALKASQTHENRRFLQGRAITFAEAFEAEH